MRADLRRSALFGSIAGLLAIILTIVIAMIGPPPAGGSGERLMGASILITRIGAPLSLAVALFADAVGSDSPLFPLTYVLLLAAILFEWAVGGLLVGWVISRWRRTPSE